MIDKYTVVTSTDIKEVLILPHKKNGKFSFVNITPGHEHICSCEFDTIHDAERDMENKRQTGEILYWYKDAVSH